MTATCNQNRRVDFFTDYADQTEGEEALVIPEDLAALSAEELLELSERASQVFTDLYNGGDVSEDDLATLGSLTEGIEALAAEQERRDAEAAERREKAEALAARVGGPFSSEAEAEKDEDEDEDEDEKNAAEESSEREPDEQEDEDEAASDQEAAETVTAGAAPPRRELRVNLAGLSSRQRAQHRPESTGDLTLKDVVMAAPDLPGFSNGQGMDFNDLGAAVATRLQGFQASRYEAAAKAGRHIRQQFGVATVRKPFDPRLRVESMDGPSVEAAMNFAADETRLPGGSLVASGGWCAPSETLYDLYEVESRDGLFSLPEINVTRGGIRFTPGPSFADIFSNIEGFSYTEAKDIEGDYDGQGGGSKPCYKVDCPDWDEVRLDLEGLCIQAGLLQRRAYPEYIARVIRGALIAHDHRVSARKINTIVAGSDAVSMPAGQVGTLAPLLTAIELQSEHYKDTHRLGRNTSLEAVFPFWVRGAIRSDLSRRLGVDMIDVSDARINAWFASRGVNPQFVYNWQGASAGTSASTFTQWPNAVSFLLYRAGTWVAGSTDVISMDTVFDSTLLGTNDYTALFTEEGVLVAKRGNDSRLVTTPICANGATSAGVSIDCNGSEVAPVTP